MRALTDLFQSLISKFRRESSHKSRVRAARQKISAKYSKAFKKLAE